MKAFLKKLLTFKYFRVKLLWVVLSLNAILNATSTEDIINQSQSSLSNSFPSLVGEQLLWGNKLTLLGFLERNKIPQKLYYNLSSQDKELSADIQSNVTYYTLRDENNTLIQALIPISQDLQIHLYKKGEQYFLDFIPIIYTRKEKTLILSLQNSPYQDIVKATNDPLLAHQLINVYKKSVPFKRLARNDKIAIVYTRDYRVGQAFGQPAIKMAMVGTRYHNYYVFSHSNGRYYDSKAEEVAGFLLETPVKYTRISSSFSYGRFHPILKVKRPHYGVDYAAKKGTLVHSASEGRIGFIGDRGGYGKMIEINYMGELRLVYAHMSAFAKGLKKGSYVRKGQVIGRVGSTGLSTGPHLHFGVYKNSLPINPLGHIRTTKSKLHGKQKEAFLEKTKLSKQTLEKVFKDHSFDKQSYYLLEGF
ncbi:peptidoglycan DD-metalloendopeptidase family protein [Helicobacter cetorum]|uniref:peptidoglycan DD-metalloendopeptidase family protein n=1 Tax=Helicobacter cetorum TaxID=138563 RepID=UPI000CF192AA|nr:peptidoglycan DD-metalloendopeptidase family protein [Helicobacter cetorum]